MASSNIQRLKIADAAKYIGYSAAYVRSLIHEGKLPSEMLPISEGSEVLRHMIAVKDLDDFVENHQGRNRRDDGRNKYIMYATPEEYKESVRVLRAAGRTTHAVADLIVPANIRKPE